MSPGFFRATDGTRRSRSIQTGHFLVQWPTWLRFGRKAALRAFVVRARQTWGLTRVIRCTLKSWCSCMSSGMCSIFSPQMRITSTESRFRTPTKCCGTADRKSNPKAGGARFRPRADDKRLKTSPRPRPGRETIWRVPTLLAKPSPIGTSGRIQLTLCRAVVCSHWLVVDGWGGRSWESCAPCLSVFPRLHAHPLLRSEFHASPESRRRCELFGAAAIRKAGNQGEECEVKRSVCHDGDAQKPAKRPREGFTGFRNDEFSELQAWGKKCDQRRGNLRFDGHGDGQRKKPGNHGNRGEQKETEQRALRHCR